MKTLKKLRLAWKYVKLYRWAVSSPFTVNLGLWARRIDREDLQIEDKYNLMLLLCSCINLGDVNEFKTLREIGKKYGEVFNENKAV